MIVGFLPLDSRPCTYDIPVQLARQAGAEVLLPPEELMGNYKNGSDVNAIASWLRRTAPKCDALVVSAEQLIHGGLIQSRQMSAGVDEQIRRLNVLREISQEVPGLPIYLSNVLMRTSISAVDAQTAEWWGKINEYSKLYYREQMCGDAKAARQRCALEREIPSQVLDTFVAARQVNHAINRSCIELAAQGIVCGLSLRQEDCAPEGLQRFEQEVLLRDIEKYGISDRVSLCNGTDEAGAELLQRAIHPEGADVDVVWLGGQSDFVALFEDRPFRENLKCHMCELSLREKAGSDRVLFILPPKLEQHEASEEHSEEAFNYTHLELEAFCEEIKEHVHRGKRCYLLDLDHTNGGNATLLKCLAQMVPVSLLCGYSSWNTASNSLGTLLAQILASGEENNVANRAFTTERILDDALYQGIVRTRAMKKLQAIGDDIYNIQDRFRAEQILHHEFDALSPLLEKIFGGSVPQFAVQLRWPRLFEVAIFTPKSGGPVYGQTVGGNQFDDSCR